MIRVEFAGTLTQDAAESNTTEIGCMRWDGTETKIDLVGNLTLATIDELIDCLKMARRAREDFDREMRPRKRGKKDR